MQYLSFFVGGGNNNSVTPLRDLRVRLFDLSLFVIYISCKH